MYIKNYRKTSIIFFLIFMNGFIFFDIYAQHSTSTLLVHYYAPYIERFNYSINDPEYRLNIIDDARHFPIAYDKFNYALPSIISKDKLYSFLNLKGKVKSVTQKGITVDNFEGYCIEDRKQRKAPNGHFLDRVDIDVTFTSNNILNLNLGGSYIMANTISLDDKILMSDIRSAFHSHNTEYETKDIYVYKYNNNGLIKSIDLHSTIIYCSKNYPPYPKKGDFYKAEFNFIYNKSDELTKIEKTRFHFYLLTSILVKEEEVEIINIPKSPLLNKIEKVENTKIKGGITIFKYDSSNNIVSAIFKFHPEDENGFKIEFIRENKKISQVIMSTPEHEYTIFEYDNQGNKISEKGKDYNGIPYEIKYEYIYDNIGNWIERKDFWNDKLCGVVKRQITYF